MRRLLARILPPRSYCSVCGRAWFTDKRRPCPCGSTARTVARSLTDNLDAVDRVS